MQAKLKWLAAVALCAPKTKVSVACSMTRANRQAELEGRFCRYCWLGSSRGRVEARCKFTSDLNEGFDDSDNDQ